MKKKASILGGLAFSAALLWLAFRRVDARALAAVFSGVAPAYLGLVALTVLGELLLRGLKWSLLLAPAGRARFFDAFRIETAGLALNNILPLRLGELARAAFGAEFFRINLLTVLATILAEKALDMAALLLLAFAAAGAGGLPAWLTGRGGLWPFLAIAAAAALLAAWALARAGKFSGLRPALEKLGLGLKAFRNPAAAAGIFSLALLQWLLNALNYYWLALAFGAGTIGLRQSVILSFTGAAASSAPGMPGYFGGFELAVSAVASAWGLGRDAALAYALAAHLAPYFVITAAGIFFIYSMGHSLTGIWSKFAYRSAEQGV